MPSSTSAPRRAAPADAATTRRASEASALLEAARTVLERGGGDGFSVHDVLHEAGLGTRAFYRHFSSKETLVLAVFESAAQQEADRLRLRMQSAGSAIEAITAWIEARLDLAFDARVGSTMKALSAEAIQASQRAPEQVESAFDCMLAPLVEQLRRGQRDGSLRAGHPVHDARAIHHVVWGETMRQWSGFRPTMSRAKSTQQVLGFCLRAVGAEPASRVLA
jgi:AcrR family transcriptional regulator